MLAFEYPSEQYLYTLYDPETDRVYCNGGQHLESECDGIMDKALEELIRVGGQFFSHIAQCNFRGVRIELCGIQLRSYLRNL